MVNYIVVVCFTWNSNKLVWSRPLSRQ